MFDYIIVGAGSAGCVLANRLSANGSTRVLLLEAGPHDRHLKVRIPAAFSELFRSRRDWNFSTQPEPQLARRRLYLPRGRMLGGSSSLNAMIYVRGHPLDYDAWSAAGCAGWSFVEILPYFLRAQHQERGVSELHGVGGPCRVADQRSPSPLSLAFVQASRAAGLPPNKDFNGRTQEGTGLYQVTQRRGRRWSCADAYLRPASRRSNLVVRTGAVATRVLFDGARAAGVEYLRDGAREEERCAGEVLISAGALQSPQLLLLSGIGPADHLQRLELEVVRDLPVGRNLQDHPVVPVQHHTHARTSLDRARSPWSLGRYLLTRRGPLASNVAEAGAFARSRPRLAAPDLQFHFAPCLFSDHALDRAASGFTIGPTLLAPASRGRVSLASPDPRSPPHIRSGQLSAPEDLASLAEGVHLARLIARQDALSRHSAGEAKPGPDVRSEEDLHAWLRREAELLYHPVGTCRMGAGDDCVVDPTLRVRGIEALRVVDASVMPTIVRGNTNAATVMIAEKASDLIAADRLSPRPAACAAP